MKILLPPSEGKSVPAAAGAGLDLSSLVFPQLSVPRRQVIDALVEVSGRDDAQRILKVGSTVMDEVTANRQLLNSPVAPAHQIYTGVLFEAIEPDSLSQAQLQQAAHRALIFSGLFGVSRFTDMLPAHRLAIGVSLWPFGDDRDPGRLVSFWRSALSEPLTGLFEDQLILDCRSSIYAAVFRPPAEQTLVVNSYAQTNGKRRVVTHFAKQARGKLVGMLLRHPSLPDSIDEVAHIASQQWRVEIRPAAGKTPHQLDLISVAE